jgi:hypothetical protein
VRPPSECTKMGRTFAGLHHVGATNVDHSKIKP